MLLIIARTYENQKNHIEQQLVENYRQNVEKAIEYIDNNYMDKITIKQVCGIALMSHTYFSFIFKQIKGKTCIQYINEKRIDLAIQLLENSKKRICEISYETGFNDTAYFNKVFLRHNGLTPREYRMLLQGRGKLAINTENRK